MDNKEKIKLREGLTGLTLGTIMMFFLGVVDAIEQYNHDPHQQVTVSNK